MIDYSKIKQRIATQLMYMIDKSFPNQERVCEQHAEIIIDTEIRPLVEALVRLLRQPTHQENVVMINLSIKEVLTSLGYLKEWK